MEEVLGIAQTGFGSDEVSTSPNLPIDQAGAVQASIQIARPATEPSGQPIFHGFKIVGHIRLLSGG